jgi:hypothetical protein
MTGRALSRALAAAVATLAAVVLFLLVDAIDTPPEQAPAPTGTTAP